MFKKALCTLLVCFLVLPIFGKTNFIFADDEEETGDVIVEEKSARDRCVEDKDIEACRIVNAEYSERISSISDEIENVVNDKEESARLAQKYAEQASSMQAEIDELKAKIEELKVRIEELEKQIAINEKKVEELNGRVKDRMIAYQKTMHFNGYLEFILGSKSFSDMLRRIYGVRSVTSKDKSDREEYIEIITKLNADKKELDESKKVLDESYEESAAKQLEFIQMKEFYEELERQLQEEFDELTAQRDSYINLDDDEELKKAIEDAGIGSGGFVAAVHNSRIVEGVWHYRDDFLNGTWHTGADYSCSYGEELHAPAKGIVIRADDSCGYGYLGNTCGEWIAGGGNQVYLICEVGGVVYGFMFFHLSEVYVKKNQMVNQDEVIGLVGSSGSSTGPHCHIEMYKLGYGTLSKIAAIGWNSTFGLGRHETLFDNRCEVKDAPCICDPEDYLPG